MCKKEKKKAEKRTDENVAFEGAGHDAGVLRSTDVVGEAAFGGLLAGEARLDDARAVVDHDGLVGDHVVRVHVEERSAPDPVGFVSQRLFASGRSERGDFQKVTFPCCSAARAGRTDTGPTSSQ